MPVISCFIYLVRHAQATVNVPGAAPTANGLTHVGNQQADATGIRLAERTHGQPLAGAFTSPILRAVSTAERIVAQTGIMPNNAIEHLLSLREVDHDLEDADDAIWRAMEVLHDLRDAARDVAFGVAAHGLLGPFHFLVSSHGEFLRRLHQQIAVEADQVTPGVVINADVIPENCAYTTLEFLVNTATGEIAMNVINCQVVDHLPQAAAPSAAPVGGFFPF